LCHISKQGFEVLSTLSRNSRGDYGIGAVSERTGVPEAVLRSWENRFGFPSPERLPGGHRRYSDADVDAVRSVVRDREAGMSLSAAIERARTVGTSTAPTIFAALRRARPHFEPRVADVRTMHALSRAIEDEVLARGERAVIFASFQRVAFFDPARPRWKELSRSAESACVFADFKARRSRKGHPVEVPISRDDPLAREWSVVADGPNFGAVLAGWERPPEAGQPRIFEYLWSIEPDLVRDATRLAVELARSAGVELSLPERVANPAPPVDPTVQDLSRLTQRIVSYLA
jgi:MerR family transcriptional regulator, light-induced transcriptional regulator